MAIELVRVEKDGSVPGVAEMPEEMVGNLKMSAEWYGKVGFEPPWIGYVALDEGEVVGTCGFKTAPVNGQVEIAYGTMEGHRGKGYAKAMAQALIEIARERDASVVVTAQTLPVESASTSVLQRVGFVKAGELVHPEDGLVWEWKLPR